MSQEYGECKHGEFILSEGCPQCIAERQAAAESTGDAPPSVTSATGDSGTEIALVPIPGTDAEVMSYHQEALKLYEYAVARLIGSAEDLKVATADLSIISNLKKAMEAKRKEYLDPPQREVKAINENYKTLMAPIFMADRTTRDKILAYQQEQERMRREAEAINREKLDLAQREAALSGTGEITADTTLVEVAPEAPKTVRTELGTAGQRIIRKWELEDMAQVPEEYKILDSARITKVVKAGIPSIAGIRIYEEPILTVRAR